MAQIVADFDRHRIVSVCFIYDEKDRILILKRHPSLKVYPNLWTIPGGGMERDEYMLTPKTSPDGWENPLLESLRREVREESGVVVGECTYLNHFTFIRPDDIPVFGVRFMAPYVSGEVTLDPDDSTEFAWISLDDISSYEFLGDVPNQLRSVFTRLKNKQ